MQLKSKSQMHTASNPKDKPKTMVPKIKKGNSESYELQIKSDNNARERGNTHTQIGQGFKINGRLRGGGVR